MTQWLFSSLEKLSFKNTGTFYVIELNLIIKSINTQIFLMNMKFFPVHWPYGKLKKKMEKNSKYLIFFFKIETLKFWQTSMGRHGIYMFIPSYVTYIMLGDFVILWTSKVLSYDFLKICVLWENKKMHSLFTNFSTKYLNIQRL